jgi:hypothetical protein
MDRLSLCVPYNREIGFASEDVEKANNILRLKD